jgi:hypothetical protein
MAKADISFSGQLSAISRQQSAISTQHSQRHRPFRTPAICARFINIGREPDEGSRASLSPHSNFLLLNGSYDKLRPVPQSKQALIGILIGIEDRRTVGGQFAERQR